MHNLPPMAFGHQIKKYRKGLGLTLEELSERSGVEVGTISAAENRDSTRMEVASAVAIANALGLTVELLDDAHTDYLPMLLGSSTGMLHAVDLPSRRHGGGGVPVYTWTEIGEKIHMQQEVRESDETRRYLPWFGDDRIPPNAFAVRVEHDAFKGIPSGADVIFNPGLPWRNGAIAIIRKPDGTAVLRRLIEDGAVKKLIVHDAAPWQTEPYNPMTDEIVGIKIGVVLIDE